MLRACIRRLEFLEISKSHTHIRKFAKLLQISFLSETLNYLTADIVYHKAAKVRQHDPDFDNDMTRLINELKEHLQ
jgi:hypothetical protein